MVNPSEMLEKIAESLGSKATVKSVFGEPIHCEGKIVVPVAKVAYGFGGGGGSGRGKRRSETEGDHEQGEGGGGGGGMRAYPAGALEITESGTRFVKYNDWKWVTGALFAGAMLARVLMKNRR